MVKQLFNPITQLLVGGLEHFLFFHMGISSSQMAFIFFRGVGQPPTSDIMSFFLAFYVASILAFCSGILSRKTIT